MTMVLENLNRIFGACFPPLVILGAIGALLHLYLVFRSRNRSRLTDLGSFLALLLLFMILNRIFNPAVISYRYVIGIAVLTLGWSVRFIQQGWEYCPPHFRTWRPLILFALVFGICLGGILKEMRISKRTRRETEIIHFLRSDPNRNNGASKLLIAQDGRWDRILASAERDDLQVVVLEQDMEPGTLLRTVSSVVDELYLQLPPKSERSFLYQTIISEIPAENWKLLWSGKAYSILSTVLPAKKEQFQMPPRTPEDILHEDFEKWEEIPDATSWLKELRQRGVGFAKNSPVVVPVGWRPNPADGYSGTGLPEMKLGRNEKGIDKNSLHFRGKTRAAIMYNKPFPARSAYRCSFLFRNFGNGNLTVAAYLYSASDRFLHTIPLALFATQGRRYPAYLTFVWTGLPPEAEYFRLVLAFDAGEIMLDNLILSQISPLAVPNERQDNQSEISW